MNDRSNAPVPGLTVFGVFGEDDEHLCRCSKRVVIRPRDFAKRPFLVHACYWTTSRRRRSKRPIASPVSLPFA